MRFRRRNLRLIFNLLQVSEAQMEVIQDQLGEIERCRRDSIDLQLSYSRIGRDLIDQFLVVLDQPETHDDIRHKLLASLRDFNDEVARLEEQTYGG